MGGGGEFFDIPLRNAFVFYHSRAGLEEGRGEG